MLVSVKAGYISHRNILATELAHIDQERSNLQSTKTRNNTAIIKQEEEEEDDTDLFPLSNVPNVKTHDVAYQVVELKLNGKAYIDQTIWLGKLKCAAAWPFQFNRKELLWSFVLFPTWFYTDSNILSSSRYIDIQNISSFINFVSPSENFPADAISSTIIISIPPE